jgi:dsRNA-specific ribonuclease
VLPVEVPYMQQFVLYWGYSSSWLVSMEPEAPLSKVSSEVDGKANLASTMLAMAFGHRWPVGEKQYPVSFVCLDQNIIGLLEDRGTKEISAELMAKVSSTHLIRDVVHQNSPYFYLEWLPTKPSVDLVGKTYPGFDEAPEHVPHVAVKNWPKRVNSFRPPHPNGMPTASSKPYPRVLPADIVQLDNIPAVYAHVGMLIPSITHAFEIYLVAKDLLEHRLEATGITDLSLVVTAISTRNAQGPTDYERVEFLGDSILKLCTTINCSAQCKFAVAISTVYNADMLDSLDLKFPEGCLSPLKDKIVANSRLAQAAIDFGLDRYIIYSQAPSYNGRSMYVEDLLENPPPATETRTISTKILADVVEALIGTSFVSGGISKAHACMSLFLPEVKWESIEHDREILYNEAPHDEPLPVTMRQLESLIGYTFTKKSLLVEAMTHPSCNSPGIRASLDRLEFLGDAILDYVVVNKLFVINDPAPLENSMLHLLRTALVNKDILAFLVMEWATEQECIDVDTTAATGDEPEINLVKSRTPLALWTFLRHASPELAEHQRATSRRHAALREDILHELWHGTHYPWAMFSKLQAQKSFSDLFESLLGAIWVDSGSLEECDKFVERAGILPLMRRLLERGERLLHPKEALGTLVGAEKVKYVIDVKRESKGGYWTKEIGCRIYEGSKKMADVWCCFSSEEARVKAAEAAVGVLKGKGKGKEVERDREREKEMEKEEEEGEEGEEEVDMDLAFTDC